MDRPRLLVIAADATRREDLVRRLEAADHDTVGRASLDGLGVREVRSCSVLVHDAAHLDEADALELLDTARRRDSFLPVVLHTVEPDMDSAVKLMQSGAYTVVTQRDGDAPLLQAVAQATRHRRLELKNAELRRSLETHERLAMIGKLAAGVAHELNNPLDGVLRYVNLSLGSLPGDAKEAPYLYEARRGLRRMADIVRDLLQFSRNASIESADENGETLAREAVLQTVALQPEKKVEVTFDFPADGVQLPRAMFQVFGNLAKNAIDAMPGGGSLRLVATLVGDKVRLEFADDGVGIPEEVQERIFEPFFTTKEVGSGTGLGLSICQRIVERLDGSILLESEPGIGTTFHIELPLRGTASPADALPLGGASRGRLAAAGSRE